MSLAKAIVKHYETKPGSGVIKRLLHAHIGGFEKPRSKKRVHASELTKDEPEYCPRQVRLLDLYDVKLASSHIDTALAVTFAEGRAKQALLNEVWLRDQMVGGWECEACKRSIEFGTYAEAKKALNTSTDHTCVIRYVEPRVEDPTTAVSGGLDALIFVGQGKKLRLVECKIMDKDMFKKIVAPLAEHKIRTQLYLRTLSRSKQKWAKQVDHTEASVLYIMRGHGMKDENGEISPFKEYTVKRDHQAVAPYSAKAHAVTLSRREPARGFPCGICKTMMDSRAATCPVMKQCFGSKHPATITWQAEGKPVHSHSTIQWVTDGNEVASKD